MPINARPDIRFPDTVQQVIGDVVLNAELPVQCAFLDMRFLYPAIRSWHNNHQYIFRLRFFIEPL